MAWMASYRCFLFCHCPFNGYPTQCVQRIQICLLCAKDSPRAPGPQGNGTVVRIMSLMTTILNRLCLDFYNHTSASRWCIWSLVHSISRLPPQAPQRHAALRCRDPQTIAQVSRCFLIKLYALTPYMFSDSARGPTSSPSL